MKVATLLNAVAATGAGSTQDTRRERGADLDPDRQVESLAVQVIGTFVGTVAIEVSLDGTTWFAITSKTAVDAFQVAYFPYVRGNVTAYTSGSITVKVGF